MAVFTHLPLGVRIPSSPHAVSFSLPRLQDVRGYEQKLPETMRHITSGYPRFVVHPFSRQLAAHLVATTPDLAEAPGRSAQTLWLTSSPRMAHALAAVLERATPSTGPSGIRVLSRDGLYGVSHPPVPDLLIRAKAFLQNIGGFLSSREAEDHLVRLGLLPAPHPEPVFAGDAAAEVRRVVQRALPEAGAEDLLITNCGMNAIYAAFRASAELQAQRGRTLWLQLGWLYLDTISILKKFTGSAADYVYVRDPHDLAAIERIFERHGDRVAGVMAELPTNPLIHTPNLDALSELCRRHGAHLIVDPSVASILSVDVLGRADVVVASLTKYTGSEGDLTAGLVAVNPARPDAAELRARIAAEMEPIYPRDLARLATQIGETEAVMAQINATTARVVAFLEGHPKVRDVYWALQPGARENFQRIARGPDTTGGMISFTVRGPMEAVYDKLRLPKGPSFGMKTTLICPFMYLAHYDLVATPAGIAELAASRLDPDLLRLCCGTEPAEEIIAALEEALG